jgi:hypothetical protein
VTEQLDVSWVYNVPPLTTFRMVTRLDHLQEKARHLEQNDYTVLELRERGGIFRSIVERQATDIMPSKGRLFSGKSMLKETQLWEQPNWDGSRRYEAIFELSAAAAGIHGTGELAPTGSAGTQYKLMLTIESAGRFGGRKTETEIVDALGRTLEEEHKFRLLWLDRQQSTYGI